MSERKRYFGRIFFPEKPDRKFESAWLTVGADAIFVEAAIDFNKRQEWLIVLGEFNGMDKVTLINCWTGTGGFGAGGSFNTIRAKFLLEGTHVVAYNELKFSKAVTFSPALREWIRDNDWIEGKGSQYVIPEHKEIVRVQLPAFELIINKGHSIRHGVELHARNVCSIQLIPNESVHLNVILETLHLFRKFVLFISNLNPEFDVTYIHIGDMQYELKMVSSPLDDKKFTQPLRIEYRDFKNDLNQIIKSWFTKEELHPVIDLVLEKFFNRELSVPAFFLNVCVAVETLHRKFGTTNRKKIKPPPNKQSIIERLQDDALLLAWFEENAREWEKPTLFERLQEFKPTIEQIIANTFPFDAEEFIKKVKQTRNDMAHEGDWKKRFTYWELFLASKVLEYTLRIEILKIFDVDVNKPNKSLVKQATDNIAMLARLNNYNQSNKNA